MKIKRYFEKFLNKTILKNKKIRILKRAHNKDLREAEKLKNRSYEEWKRVMTKDYEDFTGYEMNWDNPERFTQKIVWRMLNDANPIYSKLTDKYAVREWVAKKIGEDHLIPLLGVWDRAEDIDFDNLPEQFVLKTNNASATNLIVRDKKTLKKKEVVENFRYWLKYPFWTINGEFHYKAIEPKIIAEKYMLLPGMTDFPDYKFFCFDGSVLYVLIIENVMNGREYGRSIWVDQNANILPFDIGHFEHKTDNVTVPVNFREMVDIAEKLAQGFAHVRVDLYDVCGKVYFGEMTFTSGAGQYLFDPEEWDYAFGATWQITNPQIDTRIVDF